MALLAAGSRYPYSLDIPDRPDSLAPRVRVSDSGTVPGTDALVNAVRDSGLVARTPFYEDAPSGISVHGPPPLMPRSHFIPAGAGYGGPESMFCNGFAEYVAPDFEIR